MTLHHADCDLVGVGITELESNHFQNTMASFINIAASVAFAISPAALAFGFATHNMLDQVSENTIIVSERREL